MSETSRIDEVAKYYTPIEKLEQWSGLLFWIIVTLSFSLLFSESYPELISNFLKIVFLILTLIFFTLSLCSKLFLIPKAEQARRKQNISNAIGSNLTEDETELYYNNKYKASVLRLGANTFENSLFSKEIASAMLLLKRITVGGYLLVWIIVLICRESSLDLVSWLTQFVFSGEIIAGWLSLELLRTRHDKVYQRSYEFFRHGIKDDSIDGVASILDIFADYEAAKSSAGIKLSSKWFDKLNPKLTEQWETIKSKLNMNE